MDQVDLVLEDQPPHLARRLRHAQWRGDLERRLDVVGARASHVEHQVAARRDNPHLVTTLVQLASQGHHDAF